MSHQKEIKMSKNPYTNFQIEVVENGYIMRAGHGLHRGVENDVYVFDTIHQAADFIQTQSPFELVGVW
jgi:hypothetical protein